MFEELFGLDPAYDQLDRQIMQQTHSAMADIDLIGQYNQLKVLKAFIKNKVSSYHLGISTGYGYGDDGRDTLGQVFADCFGAEDALCRLQIMSGTHALTIALFGLLRSGDQMYCVTGRPYDTLCDVIGLGENRYGSLREFGIGYEESPLDLSDEGLRVIENKARKARVVYLQRSRGYSARPSLSIDDIKKIAQAAKKANPDCVILVDNCYGEFTCRQEPLEVGADLIAGSLIKNPGGAVAETGGYIAGSHDLVELCAHRMSAPGPGREIGCSLQGLRNLYLGLYLAPSITAEAMKSSVYASALFESLGYKVSPAYDGPRSDIVTSVNMRDEEEITLFCRAIQSSSPVDSHLTPQAWDMPGYSDPVIMSSGAFTGGSSIELSCDAPMRPPFTVYLQGGISLASSRYALLRAAQQLKKDAV